MKLKFEFWFRGFLVLLLLTLFWSVWVSAQPAGTNATNSVVSPAPTNSIATRLSQIDEDYVSFGLNRLEWMREHYLFGEPVWKYVASLVFVFLAFYVSKILDYLTRVWLKRIAERTQTRFDDLLLEVLNGPVKVVTFVIFLHIGLGVFRWPPAVGSVLSRGLIIVVA